MTLATRTERAADDRGVRWLRAWPRSRRGAAHRRESDRRRTPFRTPWTFILYALERSRRRESTVFSPPVMRHRASPGAAPTSRLRGKPASARTSRREKRARCVRGSSGRARKGGRSARAAAARRRSDARLPRRARPPRPSRGRAGPSLLQAPCRAFRVRTWPGRSERATAPAAQRGALQTPAYPRRFLLLRDEARGRAAPAAAQRGS